MNERGRQHEARPTREAIRDFIVKYGERFGIPKQTERTVLSGNPRIGRVTHVHQMHSIQESEHIPALNDAVKELVAQYQTEILRHLQSTHYDAIFVEGMPHNSTKKISDARPHVLRAFPHGIPHTEIDLTHEQRACLFSFDAGVVYSILTNTPLFGAEQRYIQEAGARSLESNKGYRHGDVRTQISLFFARERFASKMVRTYLDAHPGKRVALIYGAGHTFGKSFERDLPLQGVWWKRFGRRTEADRPEVSEIAFTALDEAYESVADGSLPNLDSARRSRAHRAQVKKRIKVEQNQKAARERKKGNASVEKKTDRLVESSIAFEDFNEKMKRT